MKLNHPLALRNLGDVDPAIFDRPIFEPFVKRHFFAETQEIRCVRHGGVGSMATVCVGHFRQHYDRFVFAEQAREEIEIENKLPMGIETPAPDPLAPVTNGWAHDEVAAQKIGDAAGAPKRARRSANGLKEVFEAIDEGKYR